MYMVALIRRVWSALSLRGRCILALRRAHATSQLALERREIARVLVVCYGNICRSPVAEIALRRMLPGNVEIASAGFHSVAGRRSPESYAALASSIGLDLSSHRSRVVSETELAAADLIVVMDRHNWHQVATTDEFSRKVLWLGTRDGGRPEISDPYGMDASFALATLDRIVGCSSVLAKQIIARRCI
jgi:protein-tyrosine phosphatase